MLRNKYNQINMQLPFHQAELFRLGSAFLGGYKEYKSNQGDYTTQVTRTSLLKEEKIPSKTLLYPSPEYWSNLWTLFSWFTQTRNTSAGKTSSQVYVSKLLFITQIPGKSLLLQIRPDPSRPSITAVQTSPLTFAHHVDSYLISSHFISRWPFATTQGDLPAHCTIRPQHCSKERVSQTGG